MKVPTVTRDTVLFVVGLAGLLHETLVANIERPYLATIFAGFMGAPLFLRKDDKAK